MDCKTWPYKIELRITETLDRLESDFEKFEKLQYEHELYLQENVEYINGAILKLTIENDLTRILETAEEVNKNWKLIEELQSFGQSLNQRQKLFGHPVSKDHKHHTLNYIHLWYKILYLTYSLYYNFIIIR